MRPEPWENTIKFGRSKAPVNNFLKDPFKYNSKNAGVSLKVLSQRNKTLRLGQIRKNETGYTFNHRRNISKALYSTVRKLFRAGTCLGRILKDIHESRHSIHWPV